MKSQRHLFNIPKDQAYFNTAYFGCLLNESVNAAAYGTNLKAQPWNIHMQDFFTEADLARKLFAQLINTDENNIALIPSASYGFATAAKNLNLNSNDSIMVLSEQFPSNYYIWEQLAIKTNATLSVVPRPEDDDWTSNILNTIDDNVKIISLPNNHWTDGGYIDLEKISKNISNSDIALLIDGTQSVGALPLDVENIKPDFLVVSGYKWLLGPYNLGLCYIDPKYHDGDPLEYWWGHKEGSDNPASLINYPSEFLPGARRFDYGHKGNFHLLPPLIKALEQLLNWGVDEIYQYTSDVNNKIIENLSDVGISTIDDKYRAGHYLGIRFNDRIPSGFTQYLTDNNIHVSVRGTNTVRVTPHLWINDNDIDRFVSVVNTYFKK